MLNFKKVMIPWGSWIKWMAEKLNTSAFLFFLCFCRNSSMFLNGGKKLFQNMSHITDVVMNVLPWGLSLPFQVFSCFWRSSSQWRISPSGRGLRDPQPDTGDRSLTKRLLSVQPSPDNPSKRYPRWRLSTFRTYLWVWIAVIFFILIFTKEKLHASNKDLNRNRSRWELTWLDNNNNNDFKIKPLPLSPWKSRLWWWH